MKIVVDQAQDRTVALEQQLEEKEILLEELRHRMKNDLTMISSLISLKNKSVGDEIDLSDLQLRIDAMRQVHEKIHRVDGAGYVRIKEYIEDLLTTIFSAYTENEVWREIDIDYVSLKVRKAIPIGLIVNEMAINALQHGFNEETESWFTVRLHRRRDHYYDLIIENTGNPFPQHIDTENPKTLGLQLVSTLAGQLQGQLDIKRSPYPVFTIRFPYE
ncbi:MAG: sensor histidine kinase [Spirochaetia bacterium]|nr:sensor histidine kinase [Spirochaetia bacterium]